MKWHAFLERFGNCAVIEQCVIASPEKAMLDLFYFRSGVATAGAIQEMRFQNLDRLDEKRLSALARRTGVKKLITGAERLLQHRSTLLKEYDLS